MTAMDLLKPFLMLACAAFVTGFIGFLAIAQLPVPADPAAPAQTWSSTVSEPAPRRDPNPSRLI